MREEERRDRLHEALAGRVDPMRRDTLFRITSMTKPVTAAATMLLVEEGRLGLDEPVDRLLPELADRQVLRRVDGPLDDTVPAHRSITVRDLLTLRMGFGIILAPPDFWASIDQISDDMNEESRMTTSDPVTELQAQFSSPGATPIGWAQARKHLEDAEVFWLSTVRPDGQPHVTPLLAVWLDDALHFCTGATERKARNLAEHARCTLTTGCNMLREGLDLVVEGEAVRVTDDSSLQRLADAWEAKYTSEWHFDVRDGAFLSEGNAALVFRVAPTTAFTFGKGNYTQTRYRFTEA